MQRLLAILACASGCHHDAATTDSGAISDSDAANTMIYPVKASPNGRYLVGANDSPYLLAGDAPQALTVNVSEADAELYFANRASHGFNTAWVNLLCADYTGGRADGTTYDGIAPFTTAGDLATPNEAFFSRVDHMIQIAGQHGIQLLLDPAETGSWLAVLRTNGVAKARAYGQYLGARYAAFDNLIWMSGNDFQSWPNAGDDALVKAVALGIADRDTRHLQTVELDYSESSSVDDPVWAGFVGLNAAYTYYSIYDRLYNDYARTTIPSFMIESNYEGESLSGASHTTTAHDVRAQYYWTDLAGATGQVYGQHDVWPFDSAWRDHLDDPGAVANLYLQTLLQPRAWYDLIPDRTHLVVTQGYGTYSNAAVNNQDNDYAPTARTADGSLVLTYIPTARALTVDMSQLSAAANARWYDPTTGAFVAIAGSPIANTGSHVFSPPATQHSDGAGDWVLVLEAP